MRCGASHRVEGTLCLVRHGQAALSGSKTKAPGFAGGYLLYTANVCLAGSDGSFNSMGEGMIVNYDGVPLVTGNGIPDEIITAEVRPRLCDEARIVWGVENNIYQLGHRGYVAVKGGAQDCPYTFMQDLAAGRYRLPWEEKGRIVDGTTCGFATPARTYSPATDAKAVLRKVG